MTTTTNVHVSVSGASMSDVVTQVLEVADTSTLITVLSKRLEAQGRLLMIHDKDVDAKQPAPSEAPPKKPTAAKKKAEPTPAPAPEPEEPASEDWDSDAAVEGADLA